MAFIEEFAAKGVWALVKPFVPWVLAGSVGFAGAEVYEHKAPWGLGPKRDALYADVHGPKGYLAQIQGWKDNRQGWVDAYGRCEAARAHENGLAGLNVTIESALRDQAASDAFDQGYAAGKAVGRKQAGAADAKTPDPGAAAGPHPGADSVRDPTDDFSAGWGHGPDHGADPVRPEPPR